MTPVQHSDNGNQFLVQSPLFLGNNTTEITSRQNGNGHNGIDGTSYASSSFDNLLGSPLNGDWTFIIIDSWAAVASVQLIPRYVHNSSTDP